MVAFVLTGLDLVMRCFVKSILSGFVSRRKKNPQNYTKNPPSSPLVGGPMTAGGGMNLDLNRIEQIWAVGRGLLLDNQLRQLGQHYIELLAVSDIRPGAAVPYGILDEPMPQIGLFREPDQ